MHQLKRRLVGGLALFAVFAFGGVAFAAAGSQDDTVLNYGYDEESHFFIWNVTMLEIEPDVELLDQTLEEYRTQQFEALLEACGLEGTGEYAFTYDPSTGELVVEAQGDEGAEPAEEEFVCGDFQGGDVTGPAGQVNHGMFMKFFNEHFEGEHRGCLVREIAKSDLGKDGQKVMATGAEDDEESEDLGEPVEGTVLFTTVTTKCQKGNGKVKEGKGGPPAHVLDKFGGHPKDKKGKPENTPGGRP